MEEKREYYENGKLKTNWTETDGKKEGFYKEYYENGNLKKETNYKNNQLNGIYKEYYENGNILEIFNFESDFSIGKYQKYYENGKLMTDGQYNYNGVRDKKWNKYDEDGDLSSSLIFKNGLLEKSYDLYKNKLLTETLYFEDKTISNNFINNRLESIVESYHNKEKLKIYKYPNGNINYITTKNSWKAYYENGNLKFDYEMEGTNFKGKHKEYYENGNLKSECFYHLTDDGFSVKEGAEFLYQDSGILYQKNLYSTDGNQEKLCKSICYSTNHHIESETIYKDGIKKAEYKYLKDCTIYREYYKNGKLFAFGNINLNCNHRTELYTTGEVSQEIIEENNIKVSKYFNKQGNLVENSTLKNGILSTKTYDENLQINSKSFEYIFNNKKIREILNFKDSKKIDYKIILDNKNKFIIFYDNNQEKSLEVISNNKVISYNKDIPIIFNKIILEKLGNDFFKIKSLYNENINNEEMKKSFQKKSTRGRNTRENSENER